MKNTFDKTITVPLVSDGVNSGFKVVPNPDYTGRSLSKSYTLDELEQLGKDYRDTSGLTEDDRVISILVLSRFLAWARKREREVGE